MNTTDKNFKKFENVMDKISMPLALLGTSFLIGRVLVSVLFGI